MRCLAEREQATSRDQFRYASTQRAEARDERADHAVAREQCRALLRVHGARQNGLLERQQHTHVARRRVERADERDNE